MWLDKIVKIEQAPDCRTSRRCTLVLFDDGLYVSSCGFHGKGIHNQSLRDSEYVGEWTHDLDDITDYERGEADALLVLDSEGIDAAVATYRLHDPDSTYAFGLGQTVIHYDRDALPELLGL